MTAASDTVTKKECFLMFTACLLFLVVPGLLTHVRSGNYEEDQRKQEEFDAYCLSGKHGSSPWAKYVLQYKNPKDFLFPQEKEGFSFFRYQQSDSMQGILPGYRPVYETAFAKPGMKELPPTLVMPEFPMPELDKINRTPVYPVLPDVQYPAVFSTDGTCLAHLDLSGFEWDKGMQTAVFTVESPMLPDLPRTVRLETPVENYQLRQKLISLLNQKLMSPDFVFRGEKLFLFFAPVNAKEGGKP